MVDLLLRWWLRSGRYRWSRICRKLLERKYLNRPVPAANSLDEIQAALDQIRWVPDSAWRLFDLVSYPEATWARRSDDCDGFSCLAAALLRNLDPGYRPVLLTVIARPVGDSHTVCVFAGEEGRLRYFDNNTLRAGPFDSYREVAATLLKEKNRLVCWDVADPLNLRTISFHRALD